MSDSYFFEVQNIMMEYTRLKPSNVRQRFYVRKLKKQIKQLINRASEIPISIKNISDFVQFYEGTNDFIPMDDIAVQKDDFSHETILTIQMREDRKVAIGFKPLDPNYLTLTIGVGTKEYNTFGRIEFHGGTITTDVIEDPQKKAGVSVVIDLVHDMFSSYLDAYAEHFF